MHLQLQSTNIHKKDSVRALPAEHLKSQVTQVEKTLKEQDKELEEIAKLLEDLGDETDSLQTEILSSVEQARTQSLSVGQTRLQIEAMGQDVVKNLEYRQDLEKIIDAYNSAREPDIPTPFPFFFDLYH